MKKILGSIVALMMLAATPVMANDFWNFTYFDNGNGTTAFGSGTFETLSGPGAILNITGSANGSAITGLSSWAAADNILKHPGFPASFGGISFSTANGEQWNLTTAFTGSNIMSFTSDPSGFGSNGTISITMSVSAVPEPETYAMMLAGLGLMGAIARRRKAKQA